MTKLTNISLSKAIKLMDACMDVQIEYEGMTLEEAFEACDNVEHLEWIRRVLRSLLSCTMNNKLRNAYYFGFRNNSTHPSIHLSKEKEYAEEEKLCIDAWKASIKPTHLRRIMNQYLRIEGLKLEE